MTQQSSDVHVVGIAGSLRAGSFNRRLLAAAQARAPEGMVIEIEEIADIPLYNADLDTDEHRPLAVTRLKQRIAEADGLLLASPEYNHGVSGVLKNTIDWVSRPGLKSPLRDKPVAMMGASSGVIGTARGQLGLLLVLEATLALTMPHPGLLVGNARDKFGEDGSLVHEPTATFLADFLGQFAAWIERVSPSLAGTP